jgi:hypothetical protein
MEAKQDHFQGWSFVSFRSSWRKYPRHTPAGPTFKNTAKALIALLLFDAVSESAAMGISSPKGSVPGWGPKPSAERGGLSLQ